MLAAHPLVSGNQPMFMPHRPERPEKSEGGQRFKLAVRVHAQGRSADGHCRARRRRQRARAQPGAARRHRLRQDLHHGQGDRGHATAGADPRPQQDARRAALRRVQELLPRQRGRVLRLLLRLLPAGSVRAAHGHLHREGMLDQRADRPHAPCGDALPARARRRDHRRLGVVHLRHRLGGDVYGDDVHRAGGRAAVARSARRRPRRPALPAQRCRLPARHLPRARRHGGAVPGPFGGPRLAHLAVRRRRREHRRVRPAHRAEVGRPGAGEDLLQLALRDAEADAAAGHQVDQGRAEAAARRALRQRQAPGSAAPRAAHRLRHGDDGGDGLVRRHRELLALPHRAQTGRAAADAVRIPARQRARVRRREPRDRAADRRHVPRRLPAQGDAGRVRLPPALVHGQSSAALRGMGRHAPADGVRVGDARVVGDRGDGRRLRRAGHPPHRAHRSAGAGALGQDAGRRPAVSRSGKRPSAATARW